MSKTAFVVRNFTIQYGYFVLPDAVATSNIVLKLCSQLCHKENETG